MKKYRYIASAAAVALMGLTACSEMPEEDMRPAGANHQVRLAASTTALTRAADGIYTDLSGFTGGEQVEVFMKGTDTDTHATYNLAAAAGGSSAMTAASSALQYPGDNTDDVTLHAIYPAAAVSGSEYVHIVRHDQTTAAGYQTSDLMYVTKTVTNAQRDATQTLAFQHKLVKLVVSITKPASVSVLGGVTLENVKRRVPITSIEGCTLGAVTATVSGDEGYSSTAAEKNSISFGAVEESSTSEQVYTYACILPQTTWAADAAFITLILDGQEVTYKLGTATTLEAGHAYTLTMTDNVSPNTAGANTASLAAWGSLTEATVDAPADANALSIEITGSKTWAAGGAQPAITVKSGSTTLTAAYYDVVYLDNTTAGATATVIVIGKGSYAGKSGVKTFTVTQKDDAALTFASTSGSKTYGDADFTITDESALTNTGDGTVTYTSSDATVATVNESTGLVHILKAGTTTITATAANTANCPYATAEATYELTVNKKSVTLSPASPAALAFLESHGLEATVTSTDEFTCSEGNAHITVSSSDDSKFTASYDADTKKITITRKSAAAFSSQTVTVSTDLSSDNYTLPTNLTVAVSAAVADVEIAGNGFTINSSGTKVMFAPGNLQATYDGSSWTWKFAEHQWDYIGNAEGNTKVTATSPFVSGYSGTSTTVDLFGWVGASSSWEGVAQYGITSSTATNNTNGYGNVATEGLKSDWGNLTITNAEGYTWRTLTGGSGGEWEYILSTRTSGATVNTVSNARWTHAQINTDGTAVNGLIIFPDGCKIKNSSATSWGGINSTSSYGTKCTEAQWSHLEEIGCVFLPAAGYRYGTTVYLAGSNGYYWSSSPNASGADGAHVVGFGSGDLYPAGYSDRGYGHSVRLVRQVE